MLCSLALAFTWCVVNAIPAALTAASFNGLFVMSEGISIENGTQEVPLGSHNFITVYEIHTMANDPIINIIGNVFFYLSLVGVLLTTLITLRGWN